jgi:hypothetical protein
VITRAGLGIDVKTSSVNTLPGIDRLPQQRFYSPLTVEHTFTLCDHDFETRRICC